MRSTIEPPLQLARPEILALTPYHSARSLEFRGEIFLDANESPWPPELETEWTGINRYPSPQPPALVAALAKLYGVTTEQIIVGRGADEAIDTLTRTFCRAGKDGVIICPPTYGMYEVAARTQGAEVVCVPTSEETGFALSPEAMLIAWRPGINLVYVCSPNNPTGNSVPASIIEDLCHRFESKAIVVLDEAYLELSSQESFAARLPEFPNLVILRTLSKAWGLAGARCGAALGHPAIIALLQKVRAPYPLNVMTEQIAAEAVSPTGIRQMQERVTRLKAIRERTSEGLSQLAEVKKIFPSEGNFLLARVTNSRELMMRCWEAGIKIRDRSHEPGLSNCVRISIGSEEEMDLLLTFLSRGSVGNVG